jgi:protein-tyrosine-phosphatase
MVSEEDMEWAEAVYGMTKGHSHMLRTIFPTFTDKVKGFIGDVPDPIGGTMGDYRDCAAQLEREIGSL